MLNVLRQVSGSAPVMIQVDHFLLMLRLEELGHTGFSPQDLRRLTWGKFHILSLARRRNGTVPRETPCAANSQ